MAKDTPTSAEVIGLQTLVFLMAKEMKKAKNLTGEKIAELEKEATLLIKGADFTDGADEAFQVQHMDEALAALKEGMEVVQRAARRND